MSAARSGKSHAVAWTLSIIAVPVLYVLTLPPISLFAATRFSHSQKVGEFMMSYTVPYNWLITQKPLQDPLVYYIEFWREKFGYSPIMP